MLVYLIGMGPGDAGTLTLEAKKAILAAGVVIGARRLLTALPAGCPAQCYAALDPAEIVHLVAVNPQAGSICILMSGDTGFYSGTKRLLPLLAGYQVKVLPGISSLQYFAAQLRRPWQDWKLVSAHGKDCDAAGLVRDHAATFFLTGGRWTVPALCKVLKKAGWGDCAATAGENLGSARERIRAGTAAELAQADVDELAVLLVENPRPRRTVSCGLPDSVFVRGSVPMTKSEVRSVILSKLRLCAADIVYDIGAGTGSVSVEAALLVRAGHVYAIEHKPAGCRLIRENAKKLGVFNLTCIAGRAPDVLAGLPPPDAVFIGGSGGRLKAILERLLALNPAVRLVLSAITLETLTAAAESFFHLPLQEVEIVQIAASRARQAGGQHLMRAQNPVFIISGAGIK
jgi:precorrin-6Y C5,15-methyltransferase (decarboxylating)